MTNNLTDIKGIGNSTLKKLKKAKIKNLEDLANSKIEYLIKIDGVAEKSAKKWINTAKAKLNKTFSSSGPESQLKMKSYPSTINIESVVNINRSLIHDIQSNVNQIFIRLENIENRLANIEKENYSLPKKSIKLRKGTKIEDVDLFSNIVKDAIDEISTGRFGINKISLKELFDSINKEYYITKDSFTRYLLDLHNRNKIQLESGLIGQDFYIEDNYGNIYKLIRILE